MVEVSFSSRSQKPYEPALFFSGRSPSDRLDPTDADRVVVFHTSDSFGYDDPLGLLDLYINPDDWLQPGESNALLQPFSIG